MGESRNAYRALVGRPEGKRPLGTLRCSWEDNIKMDLRDLGYDDRDWINLAQDRDRWRAYVMTPFVKGTSSKTYGCTSNMVPTGWGHSPYSEEFYAGPEHVISRFGVINWPARSLDLSAPDYFLWGYLKGKVYQEQPHILQHSKEKNLNRNSTNPKGQAAECDGQRHTPRRDLYQISTIIVLTTMENMFIVEHYFRSYGAGRQNGPNLLQVKGQYEERFNKKAQNNITMLAVVDKFRHTGSVLCQPKETRTITRIMDDFSNRRFKPQRVVYDEHR
ncbi:hypothetical protein ANN_09698 [Periplaneta americana]|uniref:Uncharacterized protein n=1 Tax=Periplaneta americana TaxID=6978 RepID=A0ABQ8TQN0_PERAM|nr:hypothetical protein ANN_09698 [Periplaneta americana]